jgi:hypothetical protein
MTEKIREVPIQVFEFTANSIDQFKTESKIAKSFFGKAASWRVAKVYGGMHWRQPVTISIKPPVKKKEVVEILRCMADALEACPQDPMSVASFGIKGGHDLRGWYDPGSHAFVDIFSNTIGGVSRAAKSVGNWCLGLFSRNRV